MVDSILEDIHGDLDLNIIIQTVTQRMKPNGASEWDGIICLFN